MQDEKDLDNRYDEDESEIDIVELATKLWQNKKTIFIWSGIAAVIGLVVAFSIPREYTTTIKIAPEVTDGSSSLGGSLSSMASFAGINLGKPGADAVAPQLYPDVLASIPFAVELFDVPVTESKTDSVYTVREYLADHTSSPWWSAVVSAPFKALGAIMALFRDEEEEGVNNGTNPFHLTKDETELYESLGKRISADYDSKTFVNTITVTMQDPLVSALLADTVASHLQKYITEYRTSKARKDMEYAEQLNEEARKAYYDAQQNLADYLDRNQAISLHSASVTRDRLQNEADLAFGLFNSTAQQLQMAKAKVQEVSPVYAVIQPATVPQKPSKPSKIMILIAWIFLGAAAASAWILYGDKVKGIKAKMTGE